MQFLIEHRSLMTYLKRIKKMREDGHAVAICLKFGRTIDHGEHYRESPE